MTNKDEYAYKPLNDNELRLLDNRQELTGEPLETSRIALKNPETRKEILEVMKRIAQQKKATVDGLLMALQEIRKEDSEEAEEKVKEEFLQIEKEVLNSISQEEAERITTTIAWLRKNFGDRYDAIYKQVIMKINKGEVLIKKDLVKFNYANKELYKQELQLQTTEDEDIRDVEYEGFDSKVTKREILQGVLDKNHKHYNKIQEIEKTIQQEGKYIATYENSIKSILDGFEGEVDQKIKAIQLLTGFIGCGLISLEKDENHCRSFLYCKNNNYNKVVRDDDLWNRGALLIAQDC